MCGRYTNTAGVDELNEHFHVPIAPGPGIERFNIAPTEEVLAIVAPRGEPQARRLRWGLIPWWSKDVKGASSRINARVETVASSPAYRDLIADPSSRALQLADGYFEWLKPERRGEPRQPFFFQVDGGIPFAFAAVWTTAKIAGERIGSVALITCDARPNPIAAGIHDRMPAILADPEAQRAWLDPAFEVPHLLAMCRAVPAPRLSARPATPVVNSPGVSEGPELLVA